MELLVEAATIIEDSSRSQESKFDEAEENDRNVVESGNGSKDDIIPDHLKAQEKAKTAESENGSKNDQVKAQENENAAEPVSLAPVVAEHYNHVKQVGIKERMNSRIFFMRNFNNWIKSIILDEQLRVVKENQKSFQKLRGLDLCCGKGGDLKKWLHGHVSEVIFVDIANTSVEQCQERYKMLPRRGNIFSAQFITADCTKVRIREKMADVTCQLDLVSCQFAFHYCFESLPQAETMLKNASECLRTGGRFFGTIPNSVEIVRRLREKGGPIGNDVYSITPECSEPYPLFGAKYNFHLEECVDCPEFLVHFPTLVQLAKKFGLKFISATPLPRYFKKHEEKGRRLLERMKGLETYPAPDGQTLVGSPEQYEQAEAAKNSGRPVGTLSSAEWEVISLYIVFVFEKVERTTWDSQGNPVYNLD